jgi:hypothetical protein
VWSADQLARLKPNTPPLSEPSVGAIRRIGPFALVAKQGANATTFVDTSIDLSKPRTDEGESIYDREMHAEHLDRAGKP